MNRESAGPVASPNATGPIENFAAAKPLILSSDCNGGDTR